MEIAKIGGGIVGLGRALNLQQRGLAYLVVDKDPIERGSPGRVNLAGDRPFDRFDDLISQEELRALSDQYKRIAGCSVENLAAAFAQPEK